MALVLKKLYQGYVYAFDESIDPKLKGKFLVGAPLQSLAIIGLYLYFCLRAGPRFMKNRQPYRIDRLVQFYNVFEVAFCTYTFVLGFIGWYLEDYSFICQPYHHRTTPGAMMIAQGCYFYYINKYIELLDTVFFILRKKFNQVTYLHVYHHAFMPLASVVAVNWLPGGHVVLLGMTNTFIHMIMYSYYFLASLGPEWQKYLWWKKHLTIMQLAQFCLIFVHNFQALVTGCDFSKMLNILMCIESGYFFYLFGKFYINTYKKNKKESVNNGKREAKAE